MSVAFAESIDSVVPIFTGDVFKVSNLKCYLYPVSVELIIKIQNKNWSLLSLDILN